MDRAALADGGIAEGAQRADDAAPLEVARQGLPRVQVFSDIHCVTRWSRYDNLWEGVAIKEVLRRAVPKTTAHYVE